MNIRRLLIVGIFLATVGVVSGSQLADACGVAPPQNKPVAIADESAIIIWDEPSKTQHFIRRASFTTDAKDFGFLVPTPTQPELGEASDEAFKTLAKITEPKTVQKPRPSGSGCGIGCSMPPPAGSKAGSVEILDQKRIAGLDIVVLKATDAYDLTKWLTDHGYEFSPSLKDWVKPYIDAKWIITASKIAKEKEAAAPKIDTSIPTGAIAPSDSKSVSSTAVRMTFKTEKPLFPYSEPADQRDKKDGQPKRLLRVYFLGTAKVQGKLGDKGANWPGTVAWSNKIEADKREELLKLLKLANAAAPATWWLTEFEDKSSPRPGTDDLFFSTAGDQNPVERPPHIQYVAAKLPGCIMSYALVCYMLVPCLVRAVRRRR